MPIEDKQALANWFSKPGDSLRRLMHERNIPSEQIAANLTNGIDDLRGLLDGSIAIELEVANKLADTVGGSQQFWLKRQENYNLALERSVNRVLSLEIEDWLDKVPDPKPVKLKNFDESAQRSAIRRRLQFFNVPTIAIWNSHYGKMLNETNFRKSETFKLNDSSVILWMRQAEIEAEMIDTQPWDATQLEDRLEAIVKLSRISKPSRFLPKLRDLCAESGVAVIINKTPPGCPTYGASHLVSPDKALMLLSFRYLSDDQFWFTVFHEIAHLLLHEKLTKQKQNNALTARLEEEANEYAQKCIVPDNRRDEFLNLKASKKSVVKFSTSVGVSAGLIVGQMQYHRLIEHNKLNGLKRRWKWADINAAL